MTFDTIHIVLIIIIIVLLIWCIMGKRTYEGFNQSPIYKQQSDNQQYLLNTAIKLCVNHLFYDRSRMMAYLSEDPSYNIWNDSIKRNLQESQQFINKYGNLGISQQFVEFFMNEFNKFIELENKLFEAIKYGNKSEKVDVAQKLYASAINMGSYADNFFKTNIFKKYMEKYVNLLIADAEAYANGDYKKDAQYATSILDLGIDFIFDIVSLFPQ